MKATSDQGAGFGRWGFRDEFVCRPDYHPTAIAIMSANAGDLRTILARGGIPLGGSMCPMVASGGDSNSTACVVVITPTPFACVNVGDSRAVFAPQNPAADFAAQATAILLLLLLLLLLLRTVRIGYKVSPLSFDHTPAASRGVRVRSCVVVIPQPLLYVPMWEIHVPSLRRGIPRPLSPAQAAAILLLLLLLLQTVRILS